LYIDEMYWISTYVFKAQRFGEIRIPV